PTNPLADYDDAGNVDWGTVGAAGAFGACLSSVTGDAATGVDTWSPLAGCAQTDGPQWRAIPATGSPASKVAKALNPAGTLGTAHLRFGIRVPATQAPGRYTAGLTFETLAPYA
ncbi:MAG: hypothetical protein JWM98_1830, partial [Thermoleophilia bacterium]|nr:hypothetical protein [Thermoleophilia bacterium]